MIVPTPPCALKIMSNDRDIITHFIQQIKCHNVLTAKPTIHNTRENYPSKYGADVSRRVYKLVKCRFPLGSHGKKPTFPYQLLEKREIKEHPLNTIDVTVLKCLTTSPQPGPITTIIGEVPFRRIFQRC